MDKLSSCIVSVFPFKDLLIMVLRLRKEHWLYIALASQIIIWSLYYRSPVIPVTVVTEIGDMFSLFNIGKIFNDYYFAPFHLFCSFSTLPSILLPNHALVVSRVVWLLYILLITIFTAKLTYHFFGIKEFYIVLFFLVFNNALYEGALLLQTSIPAWLFSILSLYFLVNLNINNRFRTLLVVGVFLGFTILSRLEFVVVVPIFFIYIFIISRNDSLRLYIVPILLSLLIILSLLSVQVAIVWGVTSEPGLMPNYEIYGPIGSSLHYIPNAYWEAFLNGDTGLSWSYAKYNGILDAATTIIKVANDNICSNGAKLFLILGLFISLLRHNKYCKVYLLLLSTILGLIMINIYAHLFKGNDLSGYRFSMGFPYLMIFLSNVIVFTLSELSNIIKNSNLPKVIVRFYTRNLTIFIVISALFITPFQVIRANYKHYTSDKNKIIANTFKMLEQHFNKDNNDIYYIVTNTSSITFLLKQGFIPLEFNDNEDMDHWTDRILSYGADYVLLYPVYRNIKLPEHKLKDIIEYLETNFTAVINDDNIKLFSLKEPVDER